MITRKTTRVTVEIDRTLTIQWETCARAWCDHCRADVETVSLEDNGELAAVDQWLLTPGIHFVAAREGPRRICLPSLVKALPGKVLP